jgi:hypothetical protein
MTGFLTHHLRLHDTRRFDPATRTGGTGIVC